jgi:hypothetical protein
MCRMCDEGKPQDHTHTLRGSRRDFLEATATAAVAAVGLNLLTAPPAAAHDDEPPTDNGQPGRRYVIRGGHVMSMDPNVGDFIQADVLVEGEKILAVGPNLHVSGADVIDARGRIVMPGFVDTHHHLFETALRSFLADGLLFNDGKPHGGRRRIADGALQRRNRDRRGQGAQVERASARRRSAQTASGAGGLARLPLRRGRNTAGFVSARTEADPCNRTAGGSQLSAAALDLHRGENV